MLPVPGLTARTLLRWTRYMQDQAKVEKYGGRSASTPGMVSWDVVADPLQCRIRERSGVIRRPNGEDQVYDLEVVMQGNSMLTEPSSRYRLTLTEYKGPLEAIEGEPPQVKRTRVVEVASVQAIRDGAGNDVLQIVRCVNARQAEGED